MSNSQRLIKFLEELGYPNEVYLELLNHIESLPQLHYFSGNDHVNAAQLATWGFVQRIDSPIVKDGTMYGRNIYFAPIGLDIEVSKPKKVKEDLPFE